MVSLSKICFSPHIISICPWFYHIQTKNNKLKKHNLASKQRKRKKIDNFMISHSMFWNHSIEIKKKEEKGMKVEALFSYKTKNMIKNCFKSHTRFSYTCFWTNSSLSLLNLLPFLPLYTTCTLRRVVASSFLGPSTITSQLKFSRILMFWLHVVSLTMDPWQLDDVIGLDASCFHLVFSHLWFPGSDRPCLDDGGPLPSSLCVSLFFFFFLFGLVFKVKRTEENLYWNEERAAIMGFLIHKYITFIYWAFFFYQVVGSWLSLIMERL